MIHKNKLVIISGCSGGGKSTLLSELNDQGYAVVPEVGREIVKEQLAENGNIMPWQNPQLFCEMLIGRSVSSYKQAIALKGTKDQVIFFDRSFLEGISYFQTLKMSKYDHFVHTLRYEPTVFMAPPWREIFCQDDERKHSFEDAVSEYERLLEFFPRNGYQMVQLPKVGVAERAQFITSFLKGVANE